MRLSETQRRQAQRGTEGREVTIFLTVRALLDGEAAQEALDEVRPAFDPGGGRRPVIDLETLLALFLTVAQLDGKDMGVRSVHDFIYGLPRATRARLGLIAANGTPLTERQIDNALDRLQRAFSNEHDADCPGRQRASGCRPECPGYLSPHTLTTALNAAIRKQVGIRSSGVVAVDGTDAETYARRRSYGTAADVDPDGTDVLAINEAARTAAKDPGPGGTKRVVGYKKAVTTADRNRVAGLHRDWKNTSDVTPRSARSRRRKAQGPTVRGRRVTSWNSSFPQALPDGRLAHCHDSGAREGWRSGHNGQPGEVYLGREIHLVTEANRDDADTPQLLFTTWAVAPAGEHKGPITPDLVHLLRRLSEPVHTVLEDRGYSFTRPEIHHVPLRRDGINVVFDLHPGQRLSPTVHGRIIIIDGTPFPDCLPADQRNLAAPPPPPPPPASKKPEGQEEATEEAEETRVQQQGETQPQGEQQLPEGEKKKKKASNPYDDRHAFAFIPNGPMGKHGQIEFVGPAVRGTIVCVNYPQYARRAKVGAEMTSCTKGNGCACGRSITLGPDIAGGTVQLLPWGTTKWSKTYHRRSLVESGNSEIKARLKGDKAIKSMDERATLMWNLLLLGLSIALIRRHLVRRHTRAWLAAFLTSDIPADITFTATGPVRTPGNPDADIGP